MSNKKILLSSTMAILLAPAVLSSIAPQQVVKADTSIGTIRQNAGQVVDEKGNATKVVLPDSSSWFLGNTKVFNGVTYYKVATNEYVSINSMDIHGETQPKQKASKNFYGIVRQGGGIVVDSTGRSTGTYISTGSEWIVGPTINIGGNIYYQVAADGYVSTNALDVIDTNGRTVNAQTAVVESDSKTSTKKTVGTLDYACRVIDGNGKTSDIVLPAGSSWQLGATKTINGNKYYQVATNEYVEAVAVNTGKTQTKTTAEDRNVTLSHATAVTTDNGVVTSIVLPQGSTWHVDQSKEMNGNMYVRVATNEWVKDIGDTTSPLFNNGGATVSLNKAVKLYDASSNSMTRTLPGKTNWKITSAVKNQNGSYFVQVSNNEWIPVTQSTFSDTATYYRIVNSASSEPYFAVNIAK